MVSSTQRFRDNLSRVFAAARRSADGGVSPFPRARNEFLANKHRRHHRRLRHLKYPPESSAMAAVRLFRPVQISLAPPFRAVCSRRLRRESLCFVSRLSFSLSIPATSRSIRREETTNSATPRNFEISDAKNARPLFPRAFASLRIPPSSSTSTSLSSFRAAIILGTLATSVSRSPGGKPGRVRLDSSGCTIHSPLYE